MSKMNISVEGVQTTAPKIKIKIVGIFNRNKTPSKRVRELRVTPVVGALVQMKLLIII